MSPIARKLVTNEARQVVAIQIDYEDWLKIEPLLNKHSLPQKTTDLNSFAGTISLTEGPLEFQKRIRGEWL